MRSEIARVFVASAICAGALTALLGAQSVPAEPSWKAFLIAAGSDDRAACAALDDIAADGARVTPPCWLIWRGCCLRLKPWKIPTRLLQPSRTISPSAHRLGARGRVSLSADRAPGSQSTPPTERRSSRSRPDSDSATTCARGGDGSGRGTIRLTRLAEHPTVAAAMRRRLSSFESGPQAPAAFGAAVDEGVLDRIASLGYIGSVAAVRPAGSGEAPDPKDHIAAFNQMTSQQWENTERRRSLCR